jgi:hypothetical protein
VAGIPTFAEEFSFYKCASEGEDDSSVINWFITKLFIMDTCSFTTQERLIVKCVG